MTHRTAHLYRDVAGIVAVITVFAVAGLIAVGYGFAIALIMMLGVAALVLIPIAAIYFEERDLPRDTRRT